MKKHLPINRILLTLLVAVATIIIVFTYFYAFDANPAIEFYNLPFPTDKSEYRAGDVIYLTADYCRYTNVSYTLHLAFIDGLRFTVPEIHRIGAGMGCDIVTFSVIEIPDKLPPGIYYLQGKNEYEVNFVATRVVEWTSQSFEVMP